MISKKSFRFWKPQQNWCRKNMSFLWPIKRNKNINKSKPYLFEVHIKLFLNLGTLKLIFWFSLWHAPQFLGRCFFSTCPEYVGQWRQSTWDSMTPHFGYVKNHSPQSILGQQGLLVLCYARVQSIDTYINVSMSRMESNIFLIYIFFVWDY